MPLSKSAKIGIAVIGIPVFLLLAAAIVLKVYFSGDRLKTLILPRLAEEGSTS